MKNNFKLKTRWLFCFRTFGLIKRRFPCLSLGLRVKLERSTTIIIACVVLHNLARRAGEREPPEDDLDIVGGRVYEDVPAAPAHAAVGGAAARTSLINQIFTKLATNRLPN